jgi:DNA invertase Pin-like site-specific DNA recombinase
LNVAVYTRVSTRYQDDEAQYQELIALCRRSDWTVVQAYRDIVSGTKSANDRPQLKKLLADARQRRFQKVVVWSADRLGRSMRHMMEVLGDLNDHGIHLYSFKQGIDTSTAMGAMLWHFLGIFSEFENGIRRERQAIGIAKARERGVRFGRPRVSKQKEREIIALRAQGLGINRIAHQLSVGSGTVVRVLGAEPRAATKQDGVRQMGNACVVELVELSTYHTK